MLDEDVIRANYRRLLLRRIHGQLKELQATNSKALLGYAVDVTLTLEGATRTQIRLNRAMVYLSEVLDGMDDGQRVRVAHRRRKEF
jgi:hypothetical protein